MKLLKNSLYIVSTPIGNLDDITLRAIDRFDTILFMTVSEIPVKKGQISYHNESN